MARKKRKIDLIKSRKHLAAMLIIAGLFVIGHHMLTHSLNPFEFDDFWHHESFAMIFLVSGLILLYSEDIVKRL